MAPKLFAITEFLRAWSANQLTPLAPSTEDVGVVQICRQKSVSN
jgi:hypothetical protein